MRLFACHSCIDGWRVRLVCAEKHLHDVVEEVEVNAEGLCADAGSVVPRTPVLSHRGVPLLLVDDTDGICMHNSIAITQFLENRYPKTGTRLVPEGRRKQVAVMNLVRECHSLDTAVLPSLRDAMAVAAGTSAAPSASVATRTTRAIERELDVWEQHCKDANPHTSSSTLHMLAGQEEVSLADMCVFPVIAALVESNLVPELATTHPHLWRWYQHLATRESIQRSWWVSPFHAHRL
eukprot:EC798506.1.p1 GENE.EC798506.1~~EC798506.1.p1  ORF type:complete len:236 (+),score=49.18 EC798506.1:1-708(+)